jgi:hypothetical protein
MFKRATQIPTSFEHDGFALLKDVVPGELLSDLCQAIEAASDSTTSACAPGLRHLLRRCSTVLSFANSQIVREIVVAVIGPTARPVRAILFDKTPAANWYVTWHQDLTIAVDNMVDVPGFAPWSTKHDILHVQPPVDILESMVSLRIHLDACPEDNGAIKFIAGSHRDGIFNPAALVRWRTDHQALCCPAERGDVIIMRPLIIHSSSRSELPDRRRILHLEFAGAELPAGMDWAVA